MFNINNHGFKQTKTQKALLCPHNLLVISRTHLISSNSELQHLMHNTVETEQPIEKFQVFYNTETENPIYILTTSLYFQ